VESIRKQLRVGMPVRAVWRKPDQREGAITDILHFEPVRGRRR